MKKILKIALLLMICICSFTAVIGCGESEKFTVTFDGNGGTLISGEEVQTVESSSEIIVPTYEREGYEFIGWDNVIDMINKDTTVKAQWKADPFMVVFDGTDGTFVSGELEQMVYSASEIVLPVFVKTGYTLSWNTDISAISSATTVSAIWTANEYTLTFDLDGGVLSGEGSVSKTVIYDQPIGELPVVVKEGFDFDHWQIGSGVITEDTVWNYDTDMVAVAQYLREAEYVIRYDLQGGQVSSNPYKYSKSTSTFTLNNPTKTGYTFSGWQDQANEQIYSTVTIEKGSQGDRSFKAIWVANEYALTFDLDGGVLSGEGSVSKTVIYDQPIGELPVVVKEGFDFDHWQIGSGVIAEDTVWNYDTDMVAVAQYLRETEYVIRYDLQGGQVTSNPNKYSKSTPTFTLNNPTKTGYTFSGWQDLANEQTYPTITIEKGSQGDRTFKAIWTANSYNITFDVAGGSCPLEGMAVVFGETVGALPVCSKVDCEFLGWYLDGSRIDEDTIWDEASDKTLVAEYIAAEEYSIIYQLGGGVEGTNPNKYTEYSFDITLNNPTRVGYEFIGWTSQTITTPQMSVTIEAGTTGNLTFIANWSANEYTIIFDALDGTCPLEEKEVVFGETVGALPVCSKVDYEFLGWYLDGSRIDEDTIWLFADNKTLVAEYREAEEYSIIYQLGGGVERTNPNKYTQYSLDITLNNPTRVGYEFIGWTSQTITTPQMSVTIETGTTGNLTFTANWRANSYTLTFNTNEGTIDDQYLDGITVTYGETIGELPIPVKKGYDFVKWLIDSDEITESTVWNYLEGKEATAAYVKETEYSLTYDLQGGTGATNPASYRKSDDTFKLNNPTKTGYDFIGWTSESITTPQISVTIETGTTGNMAFTANWAIRTYVIVLDAGEGTCSKDKIVVTYNQKIGELPTCQREGYNFIGWYLGNTLVDENTVWTNDQAINLVARYKINLRIKIVLSCVFRGEIVTATVDGKSELPLISVVEGQTLEGLLPSKDRIEFMDPEEFHFYAWVNVNGVKVNESTKITPENFPDFENGTIEIIIKCQSANTKFY